MTPSDPRYNVHTSGASAARTSSGSDTSTASLPSAALAAGTDSSSGSSRSASHILSRRTLLIGIAAFLADAALMPRFSIGQSVPPTASGANAGAGNANTAVASGAFLALSKALTGHADLNPETAGRMAVALHGLNPDFATQVASLSALVQPGQEPKALLESASAVAGLREAALAIVAAWYTGTIGSGAKATVVSYYEALMYRPTADAQEVPTYCTHGGGWWTEAPPEAGVGAPQERPAASAPSTVGTPEPKQQPGKS